MTFDRERHELLNDLCKMCSRQRMLPKSMHLTGGLTGELVEEDSGGYAVISRAQHKNLPVAVKTVRITSSNFDECHRVNALASMYLEGFLTMGFVGILSRGCHVETSSTPEHPAIARRGFGKTSAFHDI